MEKFKNSFEYDKTLVKNGIKKERIKGLTERYERPELSEFIIRKDMQGECSDMASCSWGV